MSKYILEDDKINIETTLFFLTQIFKKTYQYSIFGVLLFLIYFFIKGATYTASISFYANYNDTPKISSSSILTSIAGSSLDSDDLGFSISNYLSSNKLAEEVVMQNYIIENNEINLVELWGKDYNKIFSFNPFRMFNKIERSFQLQNNLSDKDLKLLYAVETLRENLVHSENRKTSLHTVTVLVEDYPELSEQIASNIFQSIISYSNEVTNIKAKEKKQFINNRLNEIDNSLRIAENDLQLFLEKNKNISSPYLVLQKDRLERNVMLFNQLFVSLSDQLELAKIDEKDTTSSLFLLDRATASPYKIGRNLFSGSLQIYIFIYVFFVALSTFRSRKSLFK